MRVGASFRQDQLLICRVFFRICALGANFSRAETCCDEMHSWTGETGLENLRNVRKTQYFCCEQSTQASGSNRCTSVPRGYLLFIDHGQYGALRFILSCLRNQREAAVMRRSAAIFIVILSPVGMGFLSFGAASQADPRKLTGKRIACERLERRLPTGATTHGSIDCRFGTAVRPTLATSLGQPA